MRFIYLLSLLLALVSCSSSRFVLESRYNNITINSASIVSLIKPYVTSDADGVPISVGTYEYCEAFCVRDVDQPYLVTAAHCVEGLAPGSVINYHEPNGVGQGFATLEWIGRTGDRAIASVSDPQLVPLVVNASYVPTEGDSAISASAHYNSISRGKVIGELSNGWYDTTQTFTYGWSGSPVINQYGAVWGIVSRCRLSDGAENCDPDYAIISSIY